MIINQFINTHTVLLELLGSLQKFEDITDLYFDHIKDGDILNSFLARGEINSIGNNEALSSEIFRRLGLRSLILDTLPGKLSLSENNFIDITNKNAAAFKWSELKGGLIFEDLKVLFTSSQL